MESLFDPTINQNINSSLKRHREDLRALDAIKHSLETKLARVNRHIDSKKQVIRTTLDEAREFKKLMLSEDT